MISLSVQKCASETLPDEMDNDHKVGGLGFAGIQCYTFLVPKFSENSNSVLLYMVHGMTHSSPDSE